MTQSRPRLQPITKQQRTIVEHIFTYRFLTIKHLQAFLGHTHKHRIQVWLNDLIAKNYIYQIYDQKSLKATATPAVYYIAVDGVRYVRSLNRYSDSELRKRYPDNTRSASYIDHCLLIADCCANLQVSRRDTKTYRRITPTDYALIDESLPYADFLQEQQPHLFFMKETIRGVTKETTCYVVEHFHDPLPSIRIRSRLKVLLNHEVFEGDDPPILLLICDTTAGLIYVKRYVRTLLRQDEREHPAVRVTTVEMVRTHGVTSAIWEEIV
jgi:hypothetical protein